MSRTTNAKKASSPSPTGSERTEPASPQKASAHIMRAAENYDHQHQHERCNGREQRIQAECREDRQVEDADGAAARRREWFDRGGAFGPAQVRDDLAEGLEPPHVLGRDGGKAGHFLLEGGEDFHAFDGINAEVAVQTHLQGQHFRWVAGLFRDHGEDGGGDGFKCPG